MVNYVCVRVRNLLLTVFRWLKLTWLGTRGLRYIQEHYKVSVLFREAYAVKFLRLSGF